MTVGTSDRPKRRKVPRELNIAPRRMEEEQ